mgnify:CR=1 FL=1
MIIRLRAEPKSHTADTISWIRRQSIEAPEENKPIGSIVISAKDADEALSVIRQYSYDEDGEFYTTSSDRLTSMLSVLSVQGIGYSNYTPAYEGEVTFKLVIS